MEDIILKSIKINNKLAIQIIQIKKNNVVADEEENTNCFTSGFNRKKTLIRVITARMDSWMILNTLNFFMTIRLL